MECRMKKLFLISFLFLSTNAMAADSHALTKSKARNKGKKQEPFYRQLELIVDEGDSKEFADAVIPLFVAHEIGVKTPTPSYDKKISILQQILGPNFPFNFTQENESQIKQLLSILQTQQEAQQVKIKKEAEEAAAKKEKAAAAKLTKKEKAEAAAAEKEAVKRLAEEKAAKKAQEEKDKWNKFFKKISQQEDQQPDTQEKQTSRLVVPLGAKSTRVAHQLPSPERVIKNLETTISRLEAFKKRATDQLLIQVRAGYLRTLDGLRKYYFDPIIRRLQEQGQLTREIEEPLERVIALIDAKIGEANQLTTQAFLAMEENGLLLELNSYIENVPGLTHPEGNFALMAFYMDWKEELNRFKHPCIPVQLL